PEEVVPSDPSVALNAKLPVNTITDTNITTIQLVLFIFFLHLSCFQLCSSASADVKIAHALILANPDILSH
ncbi:MAG: hypothetical protein NTW04_01920, partial [Elusimicrobia bacterium]|nr:hypothetical protein [Elusimicrobiota bacterium]